MLKNGICYVVGAGDCLGLEFHPSAEDLVIAADAGLRRDRRKNRSHHCEPAGAGISC